MTNLLKGRWKVILAAMAVTLVPAGITYAVITEVVRPTPATAAFLAGIELDTDSIAVTYDAAGAEPVDGASPLEFGPIPDIHDLGTWSPVDSRCVYVHNRSDRPDLGPPTTLTIGVVLDDGGPVSGSVELVEDGGCEDLEYRGAAALDEGQRTIGPGGVLVARVRLDVDRSPGEGPFGFGVTFDGVGSDGPPDPGLPIRSTFDTDDEGWTVVGDAQGGSGTPDYFVDGGNPGGYVSASDDGKGEVMVLESALQVPGRPVGGLREDSAVRPQARRR